LTNDVVKADQILVQNSNLRENGKDENEIVSPVCGTKCNNGELLGNESEQRIGLYFLN